jgi:hypothetical protein
VPTDLYSGLVGALIGSGVGGLATFVAQRSQTSRLIEAGTEQYRIGAEAERKRSRDAAELERAESERAFGRAAAAELLDGLAAFDAALPHLRLVRSVRTFSNAGGWQADRKAQAKDALSLLRHLEISTLPLLRDLRPAARWDRLRGLVSEFVNTEAQSVHEGQLLNPSALWTEVTVNRARLDVGQYAGYVHASIGAWLATEDMPADVDPPWLSREDSEVWRWREQSDDAPA